MVSDRGQQAVTEELESLVRRELPPGETDDCRAVLPVDGAA
jgi:hypothetical protein